MSAKSAMRPNDVPGRAVARTRRSKLVAAALGALALVGMAQTADAILVRTAVAFRPVLRTAAVVGTVAVGAAVVGSMVHSLPPSCSQVMVGGAVYQQCGSSWYQPRYAGSNVTYVVVNPPH